MIDNKNLNLAFLGIKKRSETSAREKLIQTFVDVGPLVTLLNSYDHQVIFGRRGTGKTHALQYLADNREKRNDVVALVDLRTVGSNSGIYGDNTIPLAERATRMLMDTLGAIHETLFSFAVQHAESLNLAELGPVLDELATAITQVKVVGEIETEEKAALKLNSEIKQGVTGSLAKDGAKLGFSTEEKGSETTESSGSTRRKGVEKHYLNFGATASVFKKVVSKLRGQRLWILLDEWSSTPLDLQPYLADLLRRSLFPLQGVTVKIAAIEFRSFFQTKSDNGEYLGIELGADAAADVNLDDFMVFDSAPEKAKEFFQKLIAKHVRAVCDENDSSKDLPENDDEILSFAFTEKRALEEFVRACEGVPRDAINILNVAAQRAFEVPISVNHVRQAAREWYQRDKAAWTEKNADVNQLLHAVIDEVIGKRKARAFLLQSDMRNKLIDSLYDSRILHILKRGVSSNSQPGIRYDVYKLDYGCYVDLLTTQKAPLGLLPSDEEVHFVDVPPDDYRSIRRAILDPEKLKKAIRLAPL